MKKGNDVDEDFYDKFTAHSKTLAFLLDREEGRKALFCFLSRELRLMEMIDAIENNEGPAKEEPDKSGNDKSGEEKDDEDGFFKRVKRLKEKYRGNDILKTFFAKIFDKLNDLVKTYVGGSPNITTPLDNQRPIDMILNKKGKNKG